VHRLASRLRSLPDSRAELGVEESRLHSKSSPTGSAGHLPLTNGNLAMRKRKREDEFQPMPRKIALTALLLLFVLYINAFVSHRMLRLPVQSAPLWLTVVLGLCSSKWCKWIALPCFACWVFLFCLDVVFRALPLEESSGMVTPIEIATTAAVGIVSIVGVVLCLRMKTAVRRTIAGAVMVGVVVLQVAALRLGFSVGAY